MAERTKTSTFIHVIIDRNSSSFFIVTFDTNVSSSDIIWKYFILFKKIDNQIEPNTLQRNHNGDNQKQENVVSSAKRFANINTVAINM